VTRYRLLLAYDGTPYSGWQIQPTGVSIQAVLEAAASTLLKVHTPIAGSGRTDAGVHALGQVAHFTADQPLDLFQFQRSMNGMLPKEIRILQVEQVADTFHARFSATGKIYRYHLCLEPVYSPFRRLYAWHHRGKVDRSLMRAAADQFIGTHNFSSFANSANEGSAAKNPVRTIERIEIFERDGEVQIEFEGNGFLYRMVRNLVGMIMAVATGKRSLEEIDHLLATQDRRVAPMGAPAHGLFLVKVKYPPDQ
jgi:tRNA pseudouridine38-40 synthase